MALTGKIWTFNPLLGGAVASSKTGEGLGLAQHLPVTENFKKKDR